MKAGGKYAHSFTLKMEAMCYSETSVDFERTARRYIPEDSTFHNYRCVNLISYKFQLISTKFNNNSN
jgi:hypothetical protein